jgi:hypothetical protein
VKSRKFSDWCFSWKRGSTIHSLPSAKRHASLDRHDPAIRTHRADVTAPQVRADITTVARGTEHAVDPQAAAMLPGHPGRHAIGVVLRRAVAVGCLGCDTRRAVVSCPTRAQRAVVAIERDEAAADLQCVDLLVEVVAVALERQGSTCTRIGALTTRSPCTSKLYKGPVHATDEKPYPDHDWDHELAAGEAKPIVVTVPSNVYNLYSDASGLSKYIHIHATYTVTKLSGDTTPVTSDQANVAVDSRFSDGPEF